MDIGLLEKEVSKHGINEVSKKYKVKKEKIKKLLGNKAGKNNRNIINNNTKDNIIKRVAADSITKDITSCNTDRDKLKLLIDNVDNILEIVKRENMKKIKIKNERCTVTTLRVNEEIYGLVKAYSKKNRITITDIINYALVEYLERHR